jgi:hypothetical protein
MSIWLHIKTLFCSHKWVYLGSRHIFSASIYRCQKCSVLWSKP